jgi:hypothetical protein
MIFLLLIFLYLYPPCFLLFNFILSHFGAILPLSLYLIPAPFVHLLFFETELLSNQPLLFLGPQTPTETIRLIVEAFQGLYLFTILSHASCSTALLIYSGFALRSCCQLDFFFRFATFLCISDLGGFLLLCKNIFLIDIEVKGVL